MSFHVLFNAHIYTLIPSRPTVSAVAIRRDHQEGWIVEVGCDDYILSKYDGAQTKQNMHGHTIIPGLTDSHIHLAHYAQSIQKIDCEVPTKDECLIRVRDRAATTPTGKWILGHGWNQNDWPGGFGTAADLDLVAPDHPVYLSSKSLHSAWVNNAALNIAQINDVTPDPFDGIIQRNEHGNPTGILLEGAATLVSTFIPDPISTDLQDSIQLAQERLLELGLTSVHDFDGQECFSALQSIHSEGELKIRVLKNIPHKALPAAVSLGLRTGFGDNRLRIGGIKMFSDGALGPHTAAMVNPYENGSNNLGMLLMDSDEICEQGLLAVKNGLSLTIHAIGDRANHEVINALEQLKATGPKLRHRIEHAQILQPQDIHRLGELGIIASMQPIHATSDMMMADKYWGKRSKYAYALKTLLSHGTTLAFGSDAPVESPNPFWGIHAAVTRQRADGTPGSEGWYPAQRLTVHEAIQGFTIGAATAAGMEDLIGIIAPGYLADLVVLETDPFLCNPTKIRTILPLATMSGGEWVKNSLNFNS